MGKRVRSGSVLVTNKEEFDRTEDYTDCRDTYAGKYDETYGFNDVIGVPEKGTRTKGGYDKTKGKELSERS